LIRVVVVPGGAAALGVGLLDFVADFVVTVDGGFRALAFLDLVQAACGIVLVLANAAVGFGFGLFESVGTPSGLAAAAVGIGGFD